MIRIDGGAAIVAPLFCYKGAREIEKLTDKQDKFAQAIAGGMEQTAAYRQHYDCKKMSDKTIHEAASRLAKNSKVAARVAEIKRQNENTAIWTRKGTLERLLRLADGAEKNLEEPIIDKDGEIIGNKYNASAAQVAVKCSELAAKMCGYNEPDKTEVKIEPFKVEIEVIKAVNHE